MEKEEWFGVTKSLEGKRKAMEYNSEEEQDWLIYTKKKKKNFQYFQQHLGASRNHDFYVPLMSSFLKKDIRYR